jgi:hypothetical protein
MMPDTPIEALMANCRRTKKMLIEITIPPSNETMINKIKAEMVKLVHKPIIKE